jgi:hypothetical protein
LPAEARRLHVHDDQPGPHKICGLDFVPFVHKEHSCTE